MSDQSEMNHPASIVTAVGLLRCLGRPDSLGLVAGIVADQLVPDPPNSYHSVAWFGSWAGWLEQRLYRDSRLAGVVYLAACTLPITAAAFALNRVTRNRPWLRLALTSVTTWAVVGSRSLRAEGCQMADLLSQHNLPGARDQLSHLCGRLAAECDETELARATVESLAENTADSIVASLLWGSVAGVAGLVTHRMVNTLDAMVGHHNPRYENFGWAAARLDDVLDYLPARITGLLTCLASPIVGGSPRQTFSIMTRDARNHPSPNGGWCEAAFAAALKVRLGGRNVYPGGRVEIRGNLGDGRPCQPADARNAARLVGAVTIAATAVAYLASAWILRRKR